MSWGRRAWRELCHLAVGLGTASVGIVLAVATVAAAGLSLVGVGLPLLDRVIPGTRALLDRQRRRVP
ncbi:sensor domain-containing protein, partial [Micromonospora sp. NPDC000018]